MRDQAVHKPTILIVDDNPANVDLLVDLLAADCQTKVATNGARALHLATTLPFYLSS